VPALPPNAPRAAIDVAATTPVLTADSSVCRLAGPTVSRLGFGATPGAVQFEWAINWNAAVTNVGTVNLADAKNVADVEYIVTRTDLGNILQRGKFESQIRRGVVRGSFSQVTKLDYGRTYTYKIRARHFRQDFSQGRVTATYEDGCGETDVPITPPRAQTPILTKFVSGGSGVTLEWRMSPEQGQTGFLVLGSGLPSEGRTAACCTFQMANTPAGNLTWLIAPYWDTPEGRAIDVSTALRVGPAPSRITVKGFPSSDPIANTCSVNIVVTWVPVPGATGYTVYNDGKPIGARIPLTTFSFFYRQADMKLSDLVAGALLSALYEAAQSKYANQPQFTRGVNIQVAASFADRPDGVSAADPFTFSIFPCSDGRNFPSDP
jgi:hypothetical protein